MIIEIEFILIRTVPGVEGAVFFFFKFQINNSQTVLKHYGNKAPVELVYQLNKKMIDGGTEMRDIKVINSNSGGP